PRASDTYLQQTASAAGAFISNNSWHYAQDEDYDLGAAGFDAAVRDALPTVPGPQPLLVVFAAGNAGNATDDGTGGIPDSVQSPGTAKNVLTVGAIEQRRLVTNQNWSCFSNGTTLVCQTNAPWLGLTDSSNQVASFSSRGNVGPGVEGLSGRFKPDVVAPGTFVVSTRSTTWNRTAFYSDTNNSPDLVFGGSSGEVLSNLDNDLGPFYRFESGTSLAAAAVSGTLALIQEFFQTRLSQTNSPALMKALLINGAQSVAGGYDLHSAGVTNSQGWGMVRLPAGLPAGLTNQHASSRCMWLFDQSQQEALATAQQRTRFVSVAPSARNLPLRVTLVWTDPPGNPVAGLKLVNDLDLIVTNLETGEVFLGNDIPSGATYNSAWAPSDTPNRDFVNNVENVYLPTAGGSNYSVTVLARRVGVNAVPESPNGVVQDYALVISSGEGLTTDGLTLSDAPAFSSKFPLLTPITNAFAAGGADYGGVLVNQRVGGNDPLLGTGVFPSSDLTNAVITIGTSNQWRFYVFTNSTSFTNAVFMTFAGKSLSPFPGTQSGSQAGATWFPAADIDLYVSQNPGITNLDPAALAVADHSNSRTSSEAVIYSSASPGVYYIGVKCESMQGAEYGLVADMSLLPFAQVDPMGNELLRGFPLPSTAPAGTPDLPGQTYTFFVTPDSVPIRRVIVTNQLTYATASDLHMALSHGLNSAVLHNHTTNNPSDGVFVFDDSQEGDLPWAMPSDSPGTLREFYGGDAQGQWTLSLQTTNQPATNQAAWLFVERQQDITGGEITQLLPNLCRQDFVSVPALTTNLTVTLNLSSGTGPVSLQVFSADMPSSNCPTLLVAGASATGSLTVDQFSQPPLNPETYIVRSCNLSTDVVSLSLTAQLTPGLAPPASYVTTSSARMPIPDDSVSSSILNITNTDPILSVDVGVRIDHPRVSDLVISLIGPDGTRVVLDDGRGGNSSNGLGANLVVTNTTPVSFSGGPLAVTNIFETGETAGTILINYDFFALPDDMKLYYDGKLLYDSGLISFGGSTNINYGPGTNTYFTIIMNQGGNEESNTAWFYSVTTTKIVPEYFTFTENTNLTVTPIKFAPAPFTNATFAPSSSIAQNGIFYLPEESLARFIGKNPAGPWKLELLDVRAGATNPTPTLIGWQLSLTLVDSVPLPITLNPSNPSTNLLAPGQIQWYEVDAPEWVSFATNTLLSASRPLNLFFNPLLPPTGTNAGDLALAYGTNSGTWVLRTNAIPGVVPGSRYFLGLQNTNPVTVNFAFGVTFDVPGVVTLTDGVPYAGTNYGPLNNADYYRYIVSTNAVRVQFEVNAPSSDVTLVARKGLPLPALNNYDYLSANSGTNDELIVVYDFSAPVPLTAGEWFLAVINVTASQAAYSVMATEFGSYGTNIVVTQNSSTNSLCLSWNSIPGIHYHVQGKTRIDDAQWTNLSSTVTASDFTTAFCVPLPSPYDYFRVIEGLALVPAVPVISSISSLTSGIYLQWSAPTNLSFQVQWSDSVAPAHWQVAPGSITSSNGMFLFLDDGSRTAGLGPVRFYRLEQQR
ncbi:MAG TPA: S8 family serine peptidase, partial [Verrucomicrobiae bacterium]|nr:S8 family serine peptidase [Verrucomicrobiae bacterium]